jgi:hypothetical protein|tara:strand:- start:476 stop:613 length:138 start_codon:yes stop_codon:yes gene_type:complete
MIAGLGVATNGFTGFISARSLIRTQSVPPFFYARKVPFYAAAAQE